MKSLSVRGIDSHLAAILKERARESKKSVNQFVLEALRKYVGLEKEKRFTQEHSDLDDLFGRWSEEDYVRIQSKIDAERQVDRELWQ